MFLLREGPWRREQNRGGVVLGFPVWFGPGGEGEVGEKEEGVEAHL